MSTAPPTSAIAGIIATAKMAMILPCWLLARRAIMPTECLASVDLVTAVVSRDPHAICIAFYIRQGFLGLETNGFYNVNKYFAIREVTTI